MFSLPVLTALLAAASWGEAHYTFVRLAHNGVWQPPLKYIRNITSPFQEPPSPRNSGYRGWSFPTYPNDTPSSVRCGRDNMAWAPATSVLKVKPGDTMEFVVTGAYLTPSTWDNPDIVEWDNCPDGRGACNTRSSDPAKTVNPFTIFHSGPVMMHLSRVPAGQDVHDYDGSGEWVKIYTLGLEIRKGPDYPKPLVYWLPTNNYQLPPRLISTIPKQTPPGQYLMRVDAVYYGSGDADPQVYPSCAQIEVGGDGAGELPKGIKIPEDLSRDSPGMMYVSDWPNGYTYPGGPLWDGEKSVQDRPPHLD